jgi:hypothetical protein
MTETKPSAPAITLGDVRTGTRTAPDRILVLGVEGVGKSTFGSEAPSPIFIAAEDGIRHLDVASFPEPTSWRQVLESVDALRKEQHSYKTLVVDTVDFIEPLVWKAICDRNKWSSIEEPGFRKGYMISVGEWRKFFATLDKLRIERGMEVILLGHAAVKNFNNPAGEDYSRFELATDKQASALIKAWTDINLFAVFEEFTVEKKSKIKGVSSGARVIHTERTAVWDAKHRDPLPPTISFTYAEFDAARKAGLQVDTETLLKECLDLAAQAGHKGDGKVVSVIKSRKGDAPGLIRALNKLRLEVAEKKGEES